ncbi:MAG: thiamine phosphate synthase [Bacteroidales bacterium]|nr:thiamine phosphate synthase [Bacteroidales bacterium]MCM1146643.1 thiamine phosphate synthase [Bacteroidales bacterium]MCM1206035.1 thiamine phosphate synthase [Bacillota bacterium]MCM1511065.1 thiamine phosphate synthase [Clostridium sp.]
MLQFISHYTENISYLDSIRLALAGGCRWIQLRMKAASIDEIRPVAIEAQRMCREAGATFIIDDHVRLVRELRADGVHLGMKDMPIAGARRILGPDVIIGGTANTIDDVRRHHAAGADYIGCGPFRFTTTKKGLAPVLGLSGCRSVMQAMEKEGLTLPVVAIGGITANDIPGIMRTGVSGVAVSGTVLRAPDPVEEMKKLIRLTR